MKPQTVLGLLVVALAIGFWIGNQTQLTTGFSTLTSSDAVQPFFCPQDACDTELIERIETAQQSIDIAIYSFTLDSVSDALVRAHDRGVTIRVLFDSSQAASKESEDEKLEQVGIAVKRFDLDRGLMHNKFIVIDHRLVGTGSFNFSANASRYNRENLVFISSEDIATQFETDFELLWNEN